MQRKKRESAVEIVLKHLKSLLIAGRLHPGDILPPEQALADELAVSRGSVREAMKVLSAYGIVDVKQGDGSYISSASNKRLFAPLFFQILVQDRDYQSLIEIREIMEQGIVALLVEKATSEELHYLDGVFNAFKGLLEDEQSTVAECNALDIQYHQTLGEYSHNAILSGIYNFVIDLFAPTINSKEAGVLNIHRALHEALMRRDANAALEALNRHTTLWAAAHISV
jgi:DNA-binding FadR family transcriptional regulator